MFAVGDMHAAMGDSEICGTGVIGRVCDPIVAVVCDDALVQACERCSIEMPPAQYPRRGIDRNRSRGRGTGRCVPAGCGYVDGAGRIGKYGNRDVVREGGADLRLNLCPLDNAVA